MVAIPLVDSDKAAVCRRLGDSIIGSAQWKPTRKSSRRCRESFPNPGWFSLATSAVPKVVVKPSTKGGDAGIQSRILPTRPHGQHDHHALRWGCCTGSRI